MRESLMKFEKEKNISGDKKSNNKQINTKCSYYPLLFAITCIMLMSSNYGRSKKNNAFTTRCI